MQNTKDCQNDGFKTQNISLKLQQRQIRQHPNEFRFFFDQRLRKCIPSNVSPATPYRCSLSQGLVATRGKAFMEPTFSVRKRLREREIEEQKQQKVVPEKLKEPNSLLVLPRISQGSQPLVSIPASSKDTKVTGSRIEHFEEVADIIKPRNAREHWESKKRALKSQKSDLIESQRSYEDIMRLREKHLLSCNLVKSTVPRGHLTLPQLRLKTATQNLKYFEYKKADGENYGENYGESSDSDDEEDKDVLEDFCRTLNDGSKIIASNHKLSIEVFMPKL